MAISPIAAAVHSYETSLHEMAALARDIRSKGTPQLAVMQSMADDLATAERRGAQAIAQEAGLSRDSVSDVESLKAALTDQISANTGAALTDPAPVLLAAE